MPVKPWVTYRRPEPNREYLAILSELPLRRLRSLPEFFGYVWRVGTQLKQSSGLIGYSLFARPLRLKFWTLSVWDSDAALIDFVNHMPHRRVMTALQGKMHQTRFKRWNIMGSEYPPSWEDALERREAS